MARSVSIHRDAYGVPHIYGPTDESVVFGFVYAQAEDNFWQVEDNYIRAAGRASEVYGQSSFDEDVLQRLFRVEELAKEDYRLASSKVRGLTEAASAALNYFLDKNPQIRPRLLARFEPWHLFAFQRVKRYVLLLAEIDSGVDIDLGLPRGSGGSSAWAVSPGRSASGHALLLSNPHDPFFGESQFYEGHLHLEHFRRRPAAYAAPNPPRSNRRSLERPAGFCSDGSHGGGRPRFARTDLSDVEGNSTR